MRRTRPAEVLEDGLGYLVVKSIVILILKEYQCICSLNNLSQIRKSIKRITLKAAYAIKGAGYFWHKFEVASTAATNLVIMHIYRIT